MNHSNILRSTALACITLLASILPLPAQSAVPTEMTYQAFVTDAAGAPLANTEPANFVTIFRIYDSPTGSNVIWAEQQTVTIFQGNFSVLLGNGQEVAPDPKPGLAEVFAGEMRYIGITVGTNPEFTPRQRILPNAYAFRAKTAETVANGSITADSIADGTITNADLSGSINATKLGTGAISNTEFNWLNGVTSSIQNQLNTKASTTQVNAKVAKAGDTMTGNLRVFKSGTSGSLVDPVSDIVLEDFEDSFLQINAFWQRDAGILFGRPTDARYGGIIYNDTVIGNGLRFLSGGGGTRMTIADNGKVGIGTTDPGVAKLRVATLPEDNNVGVFAGNLDPFGGAGFETNFNTGATHAYFAENKAGVFGVFAGGNGFFKGNVGIGTENPTKAKLEVNGAGPSNRPHTPVGSSYGLVWIDGAASFQGLPNEGPVSIYATDTIWSGDDFVATSDARIKRIEGRSDAANDLNLLLGIEVTDYSYIDIATKGNGKQKKVIAQQVEKLFPIAVSMHTDVVPDIYQKATHKDGWVAMATDLGVGERVRLIGEKEEGIHEVLEVRDGGFRTGFAPEGEKVFVYGREVDDFRTVDYDAIAMLNVSATQELARRLESKDAEIAALRKELSELGARLAANEGLESRLAKLESLLVKRVATSR